MNFYTILSSLLKYIFITIIYLFIFGIIRMVFLDLRRMESNKYSRAVPKGTAYLELITNKENLYFNVEKIYPLHSDVIIIGRGTDCDISIDDLYLSSHNTQLWSEDNEWYIADMNSTNGTFINGERMSDEPLILDSGDRIRIGQLQFVIVI